MSVDLALNQSDLAEDGISIPQYNPNGIDRNNVDEVNRAVNLYLTNMVKFLYLALGLEKTYGPLENAEREIGTGMTVGDQIHLFDEVHKTLFTFAKKNWDTLSDAEKRKFGAEEERIHALRHKLKLKTQAD